MKKFLIIFAAVLAVSSVSQMYANRIPSGEATLTIRGYGGIVITGGRVEVCPNPNRDRVCMVLTVRTSLETSFDCPFGGGVSAFSQEMDVTPIFLDNGRALLMNNATGELIDADVLDVQVFDSVPLELDLIELPSLINPSRVRSGSMVLTTE